MRFQNLKKPWKLKIILFLKFQIVQSQWNPLAVGNFTSPDCDSFSLLKRLAQKLLPRI